MKSSRAGIWAGTPTQPRRPQYIIAGTGELRMEDGKHPVGPGSVFALPANVRHDLANTGKETLRAVAFFAAAMFTPEFRRGNAAAQYPHSGHAESRRLTLAH
jgi:oxalate decarboxylase/phosphoglucose isomerase-like protein (cupin superfamily)